MRSNRENNTWDRNPATPQQQESVRGTAPGGTYLARLLLFLRLIAVPEGIPLRQLPAVPGFFVINFGAWWQSPPLVARFTLRPGARGVVRRCGTYVRGSVGQRRGP